MQAYLLARGGDLPAARSELDAAARLDPATDELDLHRGEVLALAGDHAGAAPAFEAALKV